MSEQVDEKLQAAVELNKKATNLLQQHQIQEAYQCFLESNQLHENIEALVNLAAIYGGGPHHQQALATSSRAIELGAQIPLLYKIKAIAQLNLTLPAQDALDNFLKALELDPQIIEANYFIGFIYMKNKQAFKAIEYFKKELKINPNLPAVYGCIGDCYLKLGFATEAVKYFLDGARKFPRKSKFNFLSYAMSHDIESTDEDIYKISVENYETNLKPIKDKIPKDFFKKPLPEKSLNKRLKLGFFSPTFKSQSFDFWEIDAFEYFAKDFDLYFYHNSDFEDYGTDMFKKLATKWTKTKTMSDAELAQAIREDQVDIMFDLIGQIGANRQEIFLYKAAPVQVGWLHYQNTGGMPEIDYLIYDQNTVPPEKEKNFVEKIYKMPKTMCVFRQRPEAYELEVNDELPQEKNGYITFGYLGRINKVNDQVYQHWVNTLKAVPNSKILLACYIFEEEGIKEYIEEKLVSLGLEKDRIIFEDYPPTVKDFLIKFKEIDICLESFPYGSGSTLFSAIWMGVPMLSFYFDTYMGRSSPGILSAIGLSELVSNSKEETIEKTKHLVKDISKLKEYRENMRQKLFDSPFCDYQGFAAGFKDAMHYMWSEYCKKD